MSAVSPVRAAVRVVRPAEFEAEAGVWHATVLAPVDPEEPVFAGHYPGFPIFPGMCVVEFIHRGAVLTAPEQPVSLAAMESVRFLSPVLPGDVLVIDLEWKQDRDMWRCSARASIGAGDAAVARLRYRSGGVR